MFIEVMTKTGFKFQHKIWDTLEKDPLFAKPATKPTLKEFRLQTLKRVKKLIEYNFTPVEMLMEKPQLVKRGKYILT